MNRIPALFLLCFVTVSLHADAALDYLNSMRGKAGLVPFVVETHLQQAAQNHSDYMQTNNISGHYEDSSKSGFTGEWPLDRVVYTNYASRIVSENVSWESEGSYASSIDMLFSAIYHRYGFLDIVADEIGIGTSSNGNFYTYDMGYSRIRDLCENSTYSEGSYVTAVCNDSSKKIELDAWNSATNNHKDASPDIVVWPPENGTDIPPVFYEESPDPLPDASVSGYPVSVEFNDGTYPSPPTVSDLTIEDLSSGALLGRITLMKKENDPNGRFTDYQAASFPTKRLEWGHAYKAVLTYTYEDNTYTKSWYFKTRVLQVDRFYRIENDDNVSLSVVSGKTYGIYIVPKDVNDASYSYSISYTTDAPSSFFIDPNTLFVKITVDNGEYAQFKLSNGQTITLTIADTDNAILPEDVSLPEGEDNADQNNETDTDHDGIPDAQDTDDDNDGIPDTVEIANGLNPLDASDAQADFDKDGFSNSIELSLGTDIRAAASHPVWAPVMMEGIVTFVPSV